MSFASDFRSRTLSKTVTLNTITLTKSTDDARITATSTSSSSISAELQFGGQEQGENALFSRSAIYGDGELYTAPDILSTMSDTTKYEIVYDGKTYHVEKKLDSILSHEGVALVDVWGLKLITV